ncbi:hypothetical protein AVEN_177197-1, partial [Araneus ventricosus]
SVSECVQQSNLLPFEYERHIENLKTYLHIMKCELAQMANSGSMDRFQNCLVTIMLFKNTKLSAEMFSELSTFQGIPLPSLPVSSKKLCSTCDNLEITPFCLDLQKI